jgi:hypothetical protein
MISFWAIFLQAHLVNLLFSQKIVENRDNNVDDLEKRKRPMTSKKSLEQGCQMIYFQTNNPTLDKFSRALEWKRLVYSIAIWNILRQFGIFHA